MARFGHAAVPIESFHRLADGHHPFELAVDGLADDALVVHGFEGREALSECFSFDISVSTALLDELEESLLGRSAAFTLRTSDLVRTVRGVIGGMRFEAESPASSHSQYRVHLVPRMWLLRHRKRSRIFQDQTVPEVLTEVLESIGVEITWVLVRSYPKRAYLTQYDETDWEFVQRLLHEAGMYFFFEAAMTHQAPAPSERVVISDDGAGYVDVQGLDGVDDGSLPFLNAEGAMTSPRGGVHSLDRQRRVRPSRTVYREYDPDRPGAHLELSHRDDAADLPAFDLEVYEHQGDFLFPDWDYSNEGPRRLLRRARTDAATSAGEGSSLALLVGHRFELQDHPAARLNGTHAVTRVSHEGRSWSDGDPPRLYSNAFETVDPAVVLPSSAGPSHRALVTLTATVVGPANDDIHVDNLGRVKVRFHWDRRALGEPNNTCWIRTMQTWAGGSFGMQFIPRVGMEVVVGFQAGDPDKPLILGCVNNAQLPPTFTTPGDKERSGLRTRSTPQGGGHNELSFYDRMGEEEVFLRSERELRLHATADSRRYVGQGDYIAVEGPRSLEVGGRHFVHSAGEFVEQIDLLAQSTYADGREIRCEGTYQLQADRLSVRCSRLSTHVAGETSSIYAGSVTARFLEHQTTLVGTPEKPRSFHQHVEGRTALTSTQVLSFSSHEALTATCGSSSFHISPHRIDLEADTLELRGKAGRVSIDEERILLETEQVRVRMARERLTIQADPGASASFGAEVHIDGEKVLINSPDRVTEEPIPDPDPPTLIELVDPSGRPIPNARYVVVLDDGSEIAGRLGKDGKAHVGLPSNAEVYFPDLPGAEANS